MPGKIFARFLQLLDSAPGMNSTSSSKGCSQRIGGPCPPWVTASLKFAFVRTALSAFSTRRSSPRAVVVLHAFQKKSQRTSRQDLEIATRRYREFLLRRMRN
jgi:hypothetical protein